MDGKRAIKCNGIECTCGVGYQRMGLVPRYAIVTLFTQRDPLSLRECGFYTDMRMHLYKMMSRCDMYAIMLACGYAPSWHMLAVAVIERSVVERWIRDRVYFGKKKQRRVVFEASKHGVAPSRMTARTNEQLVAFDYLQADAIYAMASTPSMKLIPQASVWRGVVPAEASADRVAEAIYKFDRVDMLGKITNPSTMLPILLHAHKCARALDLMNWTYLPSSLGYGTVRMIQECVLQYVHAPGNCRDIMSWTSPNTLPVNQWVYEAFQCMPGDINIHDWIVRRHIDHVKWAISIGAPVTSEHVRLALGTYDITIVNIVYAACRDKDGVYVTALRWLQDVSAYKSFNRCPRAIINWCLRAINI
jgi:hypothetical protein